jgi:hypothetical protein
MRDVASTNVMTTNTTLLAINAAEILLGWIERRNAGSTGSFKPNYALVHNEFAALLRKRFSDPTLMLVRATRQTSRLFGGKVSHI